MFPERLRGASMTLNYPQRKGKNVSPQRVPIPTRDANAVARVTQAVKRRQEGWTYERIAADCSYGSPSAARKAVQRELNRVVVQGIEAWRNDWISRLEKLYEEAQKLAMDEKNKGRLFAYDRLIAIAEREAKLLGLDAKVDEVAVNTNYKKTIVLDLSGGQSDTSS
jgi:hypothetical protein